MSTEGSTLRGDALKAYRWLDELRLSISRMSTTDTRTHDYNLAVNDVLRLCKGDYVANAISVIQRYAEGEGHAD